MKTIKTHVFTFSADSTSDTLPMTSCPICANLFYANEQATRVEVTDENGDDVNDVLFHTACLMQVMEFGARGPAAPDAEKIFEAEFHAKYTTRCGGDRGGNSILTTHIIDRETQVTLCGHKTNVPKYNSVGRPNGWTSRFDHMTAVLEHDDEGFDDMCCAKCAKAARKLGYKLKYFHPTKDGKI